MAFVAPPMEASVLLCGTKTGETCAVVSTLSSCVLYTVAPSASAERRAQGARHAPNSSPWA